MDIQRITTYSLLAHINNSSVGINDLSEIFIPLVKRVISKMASDGVTKGGELAEIKNRADKAYQFDMPYPLLKKIVTKIADEENRVGSVNFSFHRDGSFIIKNFIFADYEEVMNENEHEIILLNDSYEKYLEINGYKISEQPSIFSFLDSNRLSLSEYFSTKKTVQPEIEFSVQANFVNSVKDIPKIFNVLRKVYLGSIITSYLEVDYGELKTQLEFVLDTNFLISLLDLNSKESTHTCNKIIEICKRLNYRVTVLDFTIEETRALILRTAETYESTFLPKKIDPESIYNACDRRSLSSTDLERIAARLEDFLQKEHGIYIVPNTEKIRNKAKFSSDYEKYLEIRPTKFSALHDATAVTYIRDKRGKRVKRFEEANSWFVTNTSHSIHHFKENSFLPEIIRAEDLVNLLWLTNPNVKAGETVEIGLTRMVSCAIENSLPSARVIKELDENIQKYGKEKILPDDIIRVANKIANKTLLNLEELNTQAKESPDNFVKTLQKVATKQRIEEEQKQKELKVFLLRLRDESEKKLREFRKELKETHSQELNAVTTQFDSKLNEREIESQRIKRELIKSYTSLNQINESLIKQSKKFAFRTVSTIVAIPIIILIIVWQQIGWDKFEAWTFLLGLSPVVVGYAYWVLTNKDFSIKNLWEDLKEYRYKKLVTESSFDVGHFRELSEQIKSEE